MIGMNVHLAIASVKSSKVKSLLTMIAVIIGVASFVIVTSTVDGLRNSTVKEINGLGGNLVSIVSGDVIITDEQGNESFNFLAGQGVSTITEKDYLSAKSIEGVKTIAPMQLVSGSIFRNDKKMDKAFILATSEDYPEAFSHHVESGSFLSESSSKDKFAVVGSGVVDSLFNGSLPLGAQIKIRGELFTVLGHMEKYESTLGQLLGFDQNNAVYISIENAKELTGQPAQFSEIDMQLEDNTDPNEVIPKIETELLKNHNGEKDFSVLKQDQFVGLIDSLLGTIKLAGQFLSYIMLFVASIVILLIMLITVRERTREIGIRKSIGSTNSNILIQFLTEAVVLSWIGSAIGLLVGYLLGFLLKRATEITPEYSINTILTIVLISTSVGIIAGVIPAWLAAKRDPVESLRHE